MNKKRAGLILCAMSLAVASVVRINVPTSDTRAQVAHSPGASQNETPEHKAYEFLFRRIARFRKRVVEVGQPLARDVGLQREARLSDAQMRVLENIAATCLQEVEAQDAEAQVVIKAFRAQYFPGGVVPQGQRLPPPPPGLEVMQQRRNAILLRGRGLVLASLGEGAFNQFDTFVKERFGGKLPESYANRIQMPAPNGH